MVSPDRVITIQDCRKQNMCSWGILYFLQDNGLTLQDLNTGKVTVQTLLDYNNGIATKFVENLEE